MNGDLRFVAFIWIALCRYIHDVPIAHVTRMLRHVRHQVPEVDHLSAHVAVEYSIEVLVAQVRLQLCLVADGCRRIGAVLAERTGEWVRLVCRCGCRGGIGENVVQPAVVKSGTAVVQLVEGEHAATAFAANLLGQSIGG